MMTNLLQDNHPAQSNRPAQPFNIHGFYWPRPAFLKVLRAIPTVNPNHLVFYYPEITAALSHYIIERKDLFFKDNNYKLAIVKGDPLGEAFGFDEFTRAQVTTLLRQQLVPYTGAISPERINSDPDLIDLYPFLDELKFPF